MPATHPDREKSKNYKILSRVGTFLYPYRGRVVLAALALILTSGATLALGQGVRGLVDGGFSGENSSALENALMLLMGLATIMAAGTFLRFYMVSWLGERVVADMRQAVFDRIISLHPGFFEVTKTGEVLSRLTTDTTLIQSVVGSSASMVLRSLLNFIGGLVMLFITNVKLASLTLLVVPLVMIPIIIFSRKIRVLSRDSQDRVADVGAYAEESFNAIRTVQAFGHEDHDKRLFGGEVEGAFTTAIKRIKIRSFMTASVIMLAFGAMAVILWIGGNDVISGTITPGELSAFIFYAMVVAFAVMLISEIFGELQRAAGATERLVELLDTDADIKSPQNPVTLPTPARGNVRFEGVTFRYPSRPDYAAMSNLTLDVAPGETVALVGPSGAGKSTVLQLLLRFYEKEQGDILIDDVAIDQAKLEDVRARMALVPQEPIIFAANAWENIRYGNPNASDDMVIQAAKAAAADEFICQLPDGYDTFLGEKGTRLSGGQKQRISIARALLRDPAILLLDEATSALDAENERIVQEALDKLMVGRTTLIIAHRLATVVNADRIAVIDQGELVASGTHSELLSSSPLYAKLAKLQFSADAT